MLYVRWNRHDLGIALGHELGVDHRLAHVTRTRANARTCPAPARPVRIVRFAVVRETASSSASRKLPVGHVYAYRLTILA
jgi:hypothetical protein